MLTSGTRIGPYEILDSLGAGGMGEVYRARDARLNREVAIKILPDAFAADPDRVARFTREAQSLAALNHPHIAQIYGIEETSAAATGPASALIRALVMELVPGDTLADRLAQGPIPVDEALPIARQVAEALEAAHDAGIIHRDLKPANIKLRPDGTVKVLDFGLAKATDGAGKADATMTSPAMTQAGIILGTAAYMSPEQARGKGVDKRADIWAFGCVLYEMLTGRAPFEGETVTDVIASVVKNDPDWKALPPETPANVRRAIERCLRKDPRVRLRDIGDARLEISEADSVHASASPKHGVDARVKLVLLTAAALVIGGAIGSLWSQQSATPVTGPATAPATRWSGVRLASPTTLASPVLSPDGQLLAFQTIVNGQSQIGVMNPAAGTWRVLTSDRTRGLTAVHDWSADGSRIFFDRQTDTLNGVYSVPSLGGEERLLLENAGYPSALPNGDILVLRVNAQRQTQLHRFSPPTGRVDPLPAIVEAVDSDDAMASSADGRRAYFYGQPLASANAAPSFFQLDLQTNQTTPIPMTDFTLRPPVTLGIQRNTGDLIVGGLDGDALSLVRISAQPDVPPRPVLSIPGAARFDIDAQGRVYVGMRLRPPELFSFPRSAPNALPQRVGLSSILRSRAIQAVTPLPDGSVLIGSRSADRDHIVIVKSTGEMSRLVEGDTETRPPVTLLDHQNAAVLMGPVAAPDIAVLNTTDGRLVRRFKAPSPTMSSLGASSDASTFYYADAGQIWSMPATGGTPVKIGPGDSLTVDPDSGDLIVKLDEGTRYRLVRMNPRTGEVRPIPITGDLRLIPRPLMPGAVRQGRLAIAVASVESWFWQAAVLDLKTGSVTKLTETNPSDFHYVTWRADGVPIGYGYGLDTTLWRFTSHDR